MDENQIVERLKENVPPPYETDVAPKEIPAPVQGQATTSPDYELNELVQYKLHDFFGEQYKPNDEVNRQRLQYIYTEVSGLIDNQDYGFVVAKVRELERIIGTVNGEDRLYKLYQWLKLDNTRRSIEAQMGSLSG